jgi:hypothetical protein
MRRTLAALFFAATTALAQSATFVPFGTGCTLANQTLAIGNQGLPQLGTTFQITYSGPNFTFNSGQQIAHPFLLLGLATTFFPIPVTILPQQPAGCDILVDPVVILPTPIDINGRPQFDPFLDVAIPSDPSFVGVALQAQWLTVFEQCGFAGCDWAAIPTSNAATATIGL